MVCDKQFNLNTAADTALRPFTAGTFRVCSEHNLVNRLQAYIWLLKTLYATPAGMYASQIWATPYIQQGKEMDSPLQKWLLAVLKRMLGVRDTTPSWCVMRECGLEPLQFSWFRAAMRLYNSLTKSNSYTAMKKVLHADMQLSIRSNDCWSAHILSAMWSTSTASFKTPCAQTKPFSASS